MNVINKKIIIICVFVFILSSSSSITFAQITPTITTSAHSSSSSSSNTNSSQFLVDLLKLLFSFYSNFNSSPINIPNPSPSSEFNNNPSISPSPFIASGKLGSILYWAQQISNNLQAGSIEFPPGNFWYQYYNKMMATITNSNNYKAFRTQAISYPNLYWCTYLVIDAYNLADVSGLSLAGQGDVITMQKYFGSTAGYSFTCYPGDNPNACGSTDKLSVLQNLQPGSAIFFNSVRNVWNRHEHVGLVKTVNVDNFGNGVLETYESNSSGGTVFHYPIYNGAIRNVPYPVIGFGWVN